MKTGDVLSLQTTGELVTVLEVLDTPAGIMLQPQVIKVRRPKLSENGIEHVVDTFYEFELETVEQHIAREANEAFLKVKAQRMIFGKQLDDLEASQQIDVPEIKGDGDPIN